MAASTDDERCVNPNKTLGLDEACLRIINDQNKSASIYTHPSECKPCWGWLFANLEPNSDTTLVVPTTYETHLYYTADNLQWCHGSYKFVEHGYYGWNLTDRSCSSFYVIKEPADPYMPILATFLVFTSIFIIYNICGPAIRLMRRLRTPISDNEGDIANLNNSEPDPSPSPSGVVNVTRSSTRIHSIDTFRGIAILIMIFVNNGGGKYPFFNHAPWYGLTVADLVLPWFAWIMGFTLVVSLRTQLRISVSRPRIILRSLRRSLILILLGLVVNSGKETTLQNLRFPGVLQLLGVTYFICATIEAIFMKAHRTFQYGRLMFLEDVLDCWPQWLIVILLATTHTLVTFLLPVPNCPTGFLGPGGIDRYSKYENCTGGAAGYIDRLVFGSHMYNKTHNPIYGHTLPHDPEGLMNTLSAVLLVSLGIEAGRILLCYHIYLHSKMIRWLSWASLTGIAAGFLCNWEWEGGIVPLSKNMMTISFVLATSSLAFILFAILFYLVDHKRIWNGAPFVYAGMNPIVLYVGHYLTKDHFPWSWKIEHEAHSSLLYMNLWTTALWALIAYGLYRKNIIITV